MENTENNLTLTDISNFILRYRYYYTGALLLCLFLTIIYKNIYGLSTISYKSLIVVESKKSSDDIVGIYNYISSDLKVNKFNIESNSLDCIVSTEIAEDKSYLKVIQNYQDKVHTIDCQNSIFNKIENNSIINGEAIALKNLFAEKKTIEDDIKILSESLLKAESIYNRYEANGDKSAAAYIYQLIDYKILELGRRKSVLTGINKKIDSIKSSVGELTISKNEINQIISEKHLSKIYILIFLGCFISMTFILMVAKKLNLVK